MAAPSRILVGGLPGVGKTTVLNSVAEQIRSSGMQVELVVFGSVMLEEAKKMGVTDRDQLRFLPVQQQRSLQVKAAKKINSISADFVLIDTHFVIRTPEGFWPGLPIDVLREINPTHIIMIRAPVQAIISRREQDKARKRDFEPAEQIEQELELSRQFMVVASAETGAPMKVIDNPEGKLDDAISEFLSTIRAKQSVKNYAPDGSAGQ
ncbi:MAG: adenylate kinase [Conexivisphaerales archaeon]